MSAFSNAVSLPPQQEALLARCYHPTEPFIEFGSEEIEQSIADRFEEQVQKHSQRLAVKTGESELTYDELNRDFHETVNAFIQAKEKDKAEEKRFDRSNVESGADFALKLEHVSALA